MDGVEVFLWGFLGSVALEVVLFCDAVRRQRGGRVPAVYRRPAFLVGRALLALVAGVVVVAWGIREPIQGLALGAAAPRLILWLENYRLESGEGPTSS